MRIGLVALSLLTSSAASARPARICPRQVSALGIKADVASSLGGALNETLAERGVEVACTGEDGTLEVAIIRVGSTVRITLRLLRAGAEVATGDSVTDVRERAVVIGDELWAAIDGLRPPEPEVIRAETVEAQPGARAGEPLANAQAPEDPLLDRRAWGWIAVGIGGALVGAACVTGGLALAKDNELHDLCPTGDCYPDREPRLAGRDIEAENRTMRNLALTFDILLPVGLVTAAGGVLLLTVFDEEPVAVVSPWLDRNAGGMVVHGQF